MRKKETEREKPSERTDRKRDIERKKRETDKTERVKEIKIERKAGKKLKKLKLQREHRTSYRPSSTLQPNLRQFSFQRRHF